MKLFHWRSKAMKQYGLGWLIAIADTPEQAREALIAATKARRLDAYGCELDDEEAAEFLALVLGDLAEEPETADTLFLSGSE